METNKKTVLFFPWDVSGGFGYTGRCLAVADILSAQGYSCVFSATDTTSIIRRCGYQVVEPQSPKVSGNKVLQPPPYIPFANLDSVYSVVSRYYKANIVCQDFQNDLAAIRKIKPDIIVTNMQPTAVVAARYCSIPIISLADADFLTPDANSWMPWVDPDLANILPYPSCIQSFNELLADLSLISINNMCDLMWGDCTIVPSTPDLEPLASNHIQKRNLNYVGPIFWDPPWSSLDDISEKKKGKARKVYVSIGSGLMCKQDIMQAILDACKALDIIVLVAAGYSFRGDVKVPQNVIFREFIGLKKPLDWADVVINHGGYSTVLATLLYNKPSIIIPFMSEQEANGRNFVEKNNAGFLIRHATVNPDTRRLEYSLRYSGFSKVPDIPIGEIKTALIELLETPLYQDSANTIGNKLRFQQNAVSVTSLFDDLSF